MVLQVLDLAGCLRQAVGHHEAGHDELADVADGAHALADAAHFGVEQLGEVLQVIFPPSGHCIV